MKYLYVLTSSANDFYYEQISLSITSLLLYNSSAYIELLTDEDTFKNLKGDRGEILQYVNSYKVVKFPNAFSQQVRSRLLKTNMRNLVEGDFLYLDCDTIILSSINIPSDWNFDIGAVKNLHFSNVHESPIYPIFHYFATKCGINIDSDCYYNSGVLYVKDNYETRDFFSHWHSQYLKFFEENEIEVDQLSLYKVNNDFGGVIKEIPGEWNWQAGFGLNYMSNARIMHTFSSVSNRLHDIHFLKRQEFYLNIKKRMYSKQEIISVIKNAKTSFDEALRIVPTNSLQTTDSSIADFCLRYNQILVYGIEEYFCKISCLLQQLNINVVGFISFERNRKKYSFMGWPLMNFDNLQCSMQQVGVIVAMDIQKVNKVLPSLIARGFENIYIYI